MIGAAHERSFTLRLAPPTAKETLTALFTASQITLSLSTHSLCWGLPFQEDTSVSAFGPVSRPTSGEEKEKEAV